MKKNVGNIMRKISAALNNNKAKNNDMEEDTMMENLTKNNATEAETMNDTGVLDVIPSSDLAELIPENERAVTEMDILKENKIEVIASIEPSADPTSEIPEAERGEVEKPPVELAEAREYGYLSPVSDMKGFITSTGHTIYAKIRTDPKTRQQVIWCRQQYSNGTFSKEMVINQSDLFIAAEYAFSADKIPDTALRNSVGKFLKAVRSDYYGKLLCPSERVEPLKILNMLVNKYMELPIEENVSSILEQPERLYQQVIKIIKDKHLDIVDEHESYYTLYKEQIEELAREIGTSKNKLLETMKSYRFLYRTDSSDGYQACVRFKPYGEFFPTSHTQWCYCIFKLDYLAKRKKQKEEN